MSSVARDHLGLVRMLWEKCERDPQTGCWNWTGALTDGYGQVAAFG